MSVTDGKTDRQNYDSVGPTGAYCTCTEGRAVKIKRRSPNTKILIRSSDREHSQVSNLYETQQRAVNSNYEKKTINYRS